MTGKAAQPLQEEGSYTRGPMELGLVYHFIKQREGGAKTGQPRANWHESHADPSSRDVKGVFNGYSYRYGAFYQERSKEAASLEQLLRQYPLSLQVIRGVDVCTDELGVPNWVMTPLIERVRRGASDGILALQKLCGVSLPQLRTTAHSGEDFVHLLTGLRNVDQTLGYFRLSEGDRIGHGLALGIHPKEWAQRAGRIPMMCEERLFDLVWEWSWYAEHGDGPGHGRHVVLEHEIARLSHLIFGTTQSPYDLKLLQADLGNHELLYKCGFPNRPPSTKAIESWCTATDDPEKCRLKLLHSYLVVTSFSPPGFPRG